ncbi:hypothetical protein IOL87_002155 [Salmonella enterica]|nr:hypothetical protein [Salmonella enterica]
MIITEMLAFDRASVRQFDKVGRLQIERSNLSKANVCGYFGHEIPGAEALGTTIPTGGGLVHGTGSTGCRLRS